MRSVNYDISIRVSRVGKRDEERLYSTDIQREECTDLIHRRGGKVGSVVEEKNVSGGKAAKDRGLEKLIVRVEQGVSQGIVVYDFSRFSREEPFAAMMAVGRVHMAGGVVLGAKDNYDSSAPMGAAFTGMLAEQSHQYLKLVRERSAAGREKARANNVYLARQPLGYDRDEHGVLIPGQHAWLIPLMFGRKIEGDSYTDIMRYANENGMSITVGGVRSVLANQVYIGKGKGGYSPSLVEEEVFDRVQRMTKKKRKTKTGSFTLVQGLVVCANCGSSMVVTQTSGVYYCRGLRRRGCSVRGCVDIKNLDAYVERVWKDWAFRINTSHRAFTDEDGLAEATSLRATKQFELEQIKASTSLITSLGIEAFERMVSEAAAAYDMATCAYDAARAETDVVEGTANLLERWDSLSLDYKRKMLFDTLGRIEVGTGRVPIERKVVVLLKDGARIGSPDNTTASLNVVEDLTKRPA